jgi:phosphoglycerate dehydrogenase-like enzyme
VKVLLHYHAGPRLQAELAALSTDGIDVSWTPEGDDAALLAALPDTEALLHVLEPVTAERMDRAPKLALIQKLGVGVNTIDVDAARERGIAVANLPGVNATAVAEMALGLLLAVLRRIPTLDRTTRTGTGWSDPPDPEQLGEVAGKTVGLIGYGDIARRFGAIVEAMGANVIHHRRVPDGVSLPLDDLLATSDIVSIHLPLTGETRGLLDGERLALMKRGAVLLNTGRGGIVDEVALAELLQSGHLAGAGLDVFGSEPVDPASRLLTLDNVVVTPHVAWLTADTLIKCVRLGVDNCRRVAAGQPVDNRVV